MISGNKSKTISENLTKGPKKISSTGLPINMSSGRRSVLLKRVSMDRGGRLKSLRQLTGKKLDEFARLLNMNPSTYSRFERQASCLSIDNASWITKQLLPLGIIVSANWILFGQGPGPSKLIQDGFSIFDYLEALRKSGGDDTISSQSKELQSVLFASLSEKLFRLMYKNALIHHVSDNQISPVYCKGDIVGGVVLDQRDYHKADAKECIVLLKQDVMLARLVKLCDNGRILLLTNRENLDKVQILDEAPIKIAPILWRYTEQSLINDQDMLFNYLSTLVQQQPA